MTNQILNKNIGVRLKECRELRHMTQKDLADACSCVPQTISYIENGKRGLSRDLAHRLAEVLEVKEEYILLESNFRTNSDQLKYQEEQIDINDTSIMQYLKSLGYDIGFQWKGEKDDDVNKLLDYFIHNHIDIKEKELSHTTYSNDLKITINGKSAIAHNVKVSVNKIEMDLVDYLDLIEDINNYTHFLISQLPNRKERRIHHIAISDAENEQRKSLSLTRQLEALKEDFPNATISLEQSKNYK